MLPGSNFVTLLKIIMSLVTAQTNQNARLRDTGSKYNTVDLCERQTNTGKQEAKWVNS